MNGERRYAQVLAVYFNTRGFTFVLFESSLSPVDWGVKEVRRPRRHAKSVARLNAILDRCAPDIVVIQDTSSQGTRRAVRIIKLNLAVAALAREREIPVYAYSRTEVLDVFGHLGVSNKQTIAEFVAKHVPVFERYVPRPRKPWKSEDPRMGIFDAAALGLLFFQKTGISNFKADELERRTARRVAGTGKRCFIVLLAFKTWS
jgi:hypothetical protein